MDPFKPKLLARLFNSVSNLPTIQMVRHLETFKADQSGNVGMIFGGTLLVIVSAVGGAIDYGRYLNARTQTQNAMDAASLAGARVLQLGGTPQSAIQVADTYYASQKSRLTFDDTVKFSQPTNNNTVIAPGGSAFLATPFLSIVGIDRLPVVADASVLSGACVGPACGTGANTGTSIEISMMLDTTGSMCEGVSSPCTSAPKLSALKSAAKDLIDIVVWDDQSQYTSKVAIAPFANTVNVGSYFTAVTNKSSTTSTGTLVPPCVVERTGVNEFTEVSPAGTGIAPTNVSMVPAKSPCGEATPIMPLTKDKAALKTAIDGLIGKNGTAGALGTAWAWYLLSPNWSNIFTGTAAPLPYSQLTELGASGQPKLRKIAILMTDGEYNNYQGVSASGVATKAIALCTAMKNKGIIVYTIGFQLDVASARTTLEDCASSHTIDTGGSVKNFYDVNSPTALQTAFRDIALQISKLRLSH